MADATISDSLYRVCRVPLRRGIGQHHAQLPDGRIITTEGGWAIDIPAHIISSLNQSGSGNLSTGTSFRDRTSVTLWLVSGGTQLGGTGTAYSLLVGTGLV